MFANKIIAGLRALAGETTKRPDRLPSTVHLAGSEDFAVREDGSYNIGPSRSDEPLAGRAVQRNPVP
jgi:hypothetical protein